MNFTISWGTAAAIVVVLTAIGTIVQQLFKNAMEIRDKRIDDLEKQHATDLSRASSTLELLFRKYDEVLAQLQAYKLHVAETYVNQAALQKMMDPIDRRLESIEKELREDRTRRNP